MSNMKRMAESAGWPDFRADGRTYDPEQDQRRLGKQAQAVWDFMVANRHRWLALVQIGISIGEPEASISARLRDFRKPRFGSHTVERRRRKDGRGTWEYRLTVNTGEGK